MTSSLGRETVLLRRPEILTASIDNQAVLMSVRNGQYYGLDLIGTQIWSRLSEPTAVEALCGAFIKTYEGNDEEIRGDVLDFLVALDTADLVRRV